MLATVKFRGLNGNTYCINLLNGRTPAKNCRAIHCWFQNIFCAGILFGLLSIGLFYFQRLDQMVCVTRDHHIKFDGNIDHGIPISGHHHMQHESGAQIGREKHPTIDNGGFIFAEFVLESGRREWFECREMAAF